MKISEELAKRIRGAVSPYANEFRPCAFFDDRLDCIRVIARDCSVCEERVNQWFTVLIDNYHERTGRMKYVGFTIKGARYFCQQRGLELGSPIKMTQLLDAILANSSELAVMFFVDAIARPLVKQGNIESVEMPRAA